MSVRRGFWWGRGELAVALVLMSATACLPTLAGSPVPVPTVATRPNAAPAIEVAPEWRVGVGEVSTLPISVHDSDGDPVTLTLNPPSGAPALTLNTAVMTWAPTVAGTWSVVVVATDARGARREATVRLAARHRAHADAVMGLGDSVASGHGLQESDYLGRDPCWRDEASAYPRRVRDLLVAAGRLPSTSGFALVACSGAKVGDLLSTTVGGGLAATAPAGRTRMSQVDWAVVGNPGVVTLTVGANDIGFSRPWELVRDGRLDDGLLDRRLGDLRAGLDSVLGRLLAETDARIVVTGYYDPSNATPQGFDGCRSDCFRQVVAEALEGFNATIASAVTSAASSRVIFVDLRSVFVGHGAPNGVGPDGLREGAWGFFGSIIGDLTKGTQPYCAKGHPGGDPWVNSVDCVHPDDHGAQMIAEQIARALS